MTEPTFENFMTTCAALHKRLSDQKLSDTPPRRFIHVVNPVAVPDGHELKRAQAVTFETMLDAAAYAQHKTNALSIDLVCTVLPQDANAVPQDFQRLPDISRTAKDVGMFRVPRDLPLCYDILQRAHEYSAKLPNSQDEERYIVFSNVDIGVMPHVYSYANWLINKGYDALFFNRRSLEDVYAGAEDLPALLADHEGDHPGIDFFVFPVRMFENIVPFESVIGMMHVMRALYFNIAVLAKNPILLLDPHATFHIGDERAHMNPRYLDYSAFNQEQCLKVAEVLSDKNGMKERLTSFILATDEYRWIPDQFLGIAKRRWPSQPLFDRLIDKMISILLKGKRSANSA